MSVYRIEFKRAAEKYLRKLPAKTQEKILVAIKGLCQRPPMGDIKPMQGVADLYRLRVGMYRIIFSYALDGQITIVLVQEIGSRGDVYK